MDVLAAHAARHPDKTALIEGERAWTWAELVDRRGSAGPRAGRLGLPARRARIVYAGNSLEHTWSAQRARGGLDHGGDESPAGGRGGRVHPGPLGRGGRLRERQFLPMRGAGPARCAARSHWILIGAERRAWAVHLDDLIAAGRPEPVEIPAGRASGLASIYTGGTTGQAQGRTPPDGLEPREH